ncbi:MAG TPA: ABC transporter permease [Vicinamibacterales bacterium]|nr:ABC transporter permease [Vicinamibacterales bacterium]
MFNLKLALRTLFRTPFVTTVAIVSLGLGIGANAAIFSVFNQILLKPLPVAEPGRLVNLGNPGPKSGMTSCGDAGSCEIVFSYPMFRDLETQQTPFTGIAAHRSTGANLAYQGQTTRGEALQVSGSYFQVLGLLPAAGRLLNSDDDRVPGEGAVTVLSHRYWMTRFAGNRSIVGDALIINGQPLTVVGVAPEGFEGTTIGSRPHVFVPISMAERMTPGQKLVANRRAYWIYLFARLKPGTEIAQAQAAINQPYHAVINDVEAPLQKGMSATTLEQFKAKTLVVTPGSRGQSDTPEEAFVPLVLLLGVTFVVLLSACANIANLLLAKAVGRTGEMAVRLSIGAARKDLIRQLLGESVLLAVFGGVFGLFVANWTMAGVMAMMPGEQQEMLAFAIDARVLIFMSLVTVGTGLLFGLFPALHSTRPNLSVTLKGQAGQPGGARAAKRFRATLATVQIVLSMALLAIAGLFLKSLVNIQRVDLGLDTANVVTFTVSPQMNGYPPERSKEIYQQVEMALARIPGVTGLGAGMVPLLSGSNWGTNVSVEGFPAGPDTDTHSMFNIVGSGFFKTVGVKLLAGRDFTESDMTGTPKVAIVNEAFAKKFNLGANPVGRHMQQGSGGAMDIEIVGLAKNAKYSEVKEPVPELFFTPYRQNERVPSLTFYASVRDADAVMSAVGPMMARIDSTLPVEDLRTLAQQARENVFAERIVSTLSSVFAGLATLLAAVGLYGVLAYSVAQRTREIGLRMALGADGGRIRWMVLRQVALMTVIGGVIGLGIAMAAGLLARSILYQMSGIDAVVMAASAAVLAVVALAAGFIPAYRASRVDPMLALRYE